MSFSGEVKEELARQFGRGRHCQLAELAAMLELCGWQREKAVLLNTENVLLAEKYRVLLKKAFGVFPEDAKDEDVLRIAAALRPGSDEQSLLVQQTCCRRAYIRGAFMAAGSISDPSRSYHFEIVCRNRRQAELLRELMNGFDADAKVVERKRYRVVYVKEGARIVDMLSVMEASVSLMNLENVRILKEMRNTVNRKVNCETANINKTVSAAVRQIEDIRKIQRTIGFEGLPEPLRNIARLRLEYPDATLKELGEYLVPPVGKSGVNHRLRRLSILAEDL